MAGVKPLLETIGALLPKGIKAWHASPHDFDKVDLSKIGTGQGAASYGPGFYAAEHPDVSGPGGTYWREFVTRFSDPEVAAADVLKQHGFDRKAATEAVRKTLQQERDELASGVWGHNNKPIDAVSRANNSSLIAMREKALKLLEGSGPVGPRVYELNLKADPRSFLQWDEPLSQQPNITKAVPQLLDVAREEAHNRALSATSKPRQDQLYDMMKNPEQATGEMAFRAMPGRVAGNLHSSPARGDAMQAMNQLRDAGIPGIRYADAQSRSLVTSEAATQKRLSELEGQIAGLRAKGDNLRASELDRDRSVLERTLAFPRTYNYVVNNPDIIEIMRKLAIPGMVTGGAASVYQPQGQQ